MTAAEIVESPDLHKIDYLLTDIQDELTKGKIHDEILKSTINHIQNKDTEQLKKDYYLLQAKIKTYYNTYGEYGKSDKILYIITKVILAIIIFLVAGLGLSILAKD